MIRVAALISGEPRFCSEFDNFLTALGKNCEIDWFCYVWHNSQYGGTWGWDLVSEYWLNPQDATAWAEFTKNLPSNHRLRAMVLADRNSVAVPRIVNHAGETNVARCWSMYESLHRVDLLRRAYQQQIGRNYDLVIRTRPDIGLKGAVDLVDLAQKARENPRLLFTPDQLEYGYAQTKINDMLAMGSDHSVAVYANCVQHLMDYHSRGVIFHPETLLAIHCQQQGLILSRENWGHLMLRELGIKDSQGCYHSDFGRWS